MLGTGVPALLLLLGLYVPMVFVWQRVANAGQQQPGNQRDISPTNIELVRLAARFDVLVSAIFWAWATINTANNGFDLGILSFFVVFLGGLSGSFTTRSSPVRLVFWHRNLTIGGHAFVVLNYLLGLVVVTDVTLRLYFGVSAFLWAVSGVIFGRKIVELYSSKEASEEQRSALVESS